MYASTARDVEEIQKYMEYDKSSLVYIVMATSLTEGVPPFVIQMFGSDNRFKSQDVVRRWDHTTQALKKYFFCYFFSFFYLFITWFSLFI